VNVEEEPELVRWLLVAKPAAADGLELRQRGADTATSRKMNSMLKILVPVISAGILIWFLFMVYAPHD
jgi:hypothetical protein